MRLSLQGHRILHGPVQPWASFPEAQTACKWMNVYPVQPVGLDEDPRPDPLLGGRGWLARGRAEVNKGQEHIWLPFSEYKHPTMWGPWGELCLVCCYAQWRVHGWVFMPGPRHFS